MKVQHASYQRAGAQGQARFKAVLGDAAERLQVDGLGQVAQAMSRVFKPGAEIAVDYTDNEITFRDMTTVTAEGEYVDEPPRHYEDTKDIIAGDAALEDLASSSDRLVEAQKALAAEHAAGYTLEDQASGDIEHDADIGHHVTPDIRKLMRKG